MSEAYFTPDAIFTWQRPIVQLRLNSEQRKREERDGAYVTTAPLIFSICR